MDGANPFPSAAMSSHLHLISNPAAGRGRGARAFPAAARSLASIGSVTEHVTRAPGDERRLVRDALDQGATTIAALGGDGTCSKVAAAMVEAGALCRFMPLAAGTGNDLAKSLGLPASDYAGMARIAEDGADRLIDVGSVEGRLFVNSVGFGFDAAALAVAERTPWLRGTALYLYAALNLLFRYRGVRASVLPGDEAATPDPERHPAGGEPNLLLGLVVANGSRFGGSFIIAPNARMDDGHLDLVTIADAPAVRRIGILNAAGRGTHLALAGVGSRHVSSVTFLFGQPPMYQIDGDLYRARSQSVEVRCVPGALRVVAVPAPAT